MSPLRIPRLATPVAAAAVALACLVASLVLFLAVSLQIAAEQALVRDLQSRTAALESRSVLMADWDTIAAAVQPSVVTIEVKSSLGSAWIVESDASGSDLVTNFHIVADAWTNGSAAVEVTQGDRTMSGLIARVDPADDLAIIHTPSAMRALTLARERPKVGASVMVVGSPLGLGGSVSVGVVSGYRSLQGSDYLQFSAPISPGNSGGPVVDRDGDVIAIATAKLIGEGVEGLGFGIPVQTMCVTLVDCGRSG